MSGNSTFDARVSRMKYQLVKSSDTASNDGINEIERASAIADPK